MRKMQADSGFTLLELIISIAVIAIGIFAVISLIVIVLEGNKRSKMVTTATALAQDKMEYFKRIS